MPFEIKIKGLENLISEIKNFTKTVEKFFDILKSDSPTVRCRGANLDKSEVPAFIIYKPSGTEIRCARYDTRKCRDPKLEKDADYQALPFCTYIDKK